MFSEGELMTRELPAQLCGCHSLQAQDPCSG